MSLTQDLEQVQDIIFPDSDLDSNEPPLETDLHLRQIILLIQCLESYWKDRNDFYASGNITIYYSPRQRKSEDFRGPDFFVVLNTEKKMRKSWVVWQEDGKYPNLIIEILSSSTANTDRNLKKEIYQDTFRTPNYFWFDPDSLEFVGFNLVNGEYQPIQPNERGWLWSKQLGLYLGIYERQLRFFTSEDILIPTPEELAQQESERAALEAQRADNEAQRAESEKKQRELAQQKAEKLAAKLRELGVDPEL
jgi:Uma2 family endonuclease